MAKVPKIAQKIRIQGATYLGSNFNQIDSRYSTRCSAFAPIPQISPGCYFYKFLIDGEWKNVPGFEQQFSILIFSPASGAGVTENEDGKLVLVLIVEEEEEGEVQGGKGDEANIQKEKRKVE